MSGTGFERDMTPIFSFWPMAAILVSLLGALPILLSDRQPNLRESWTILIAVVKLTIVASLLPGVLEGGSYVFTIAQVIPGVPIELRVDALGMIFALVASCLWLFTSIYSIGYMRALNEHAQTRYFASFAVAISATLGIAFAGNLLTLYLFYEVLSLSTYPLVTHEQNAEASASGRKYLTYILGTSIGSGATGHADDLLRALALSTSPPAGSWPARPHRNCWPCLWCSFCSVLPRQA